MSAAERFSFATKPNSIDRTLAWTLTGLILFVLANSYPLLAMNIEGFAQKTTLVSGIIQLSSQGMTGLAVLVMLTCVLFPLLEMVGTLYVLLSLRLERPQRGAIRVFRLIQHLRPWG